MIYGALLRVGLVIMFAIFAPTTYGYEPLTHGLISRQAVLASALSDGRKLASSAIPDFDGLPVKGSYVDSQRTERTILEMFAFGSTWEDDSSPLNGTRHFFNPLNGQGMTTPIRTFISSPDWILGDREEPGHEFTWRSARGNMLTASTATSKEQRKQFWGLTFQKLGHVIHHNQDMAQPQHSRNDAHCGGYCAYAYPPAFY